MTRPNWCDEATWKKASELGEQIETDSHCGFSGDYERLARALLAAKAEGMEEAESAPDEHGFILGEPVEKYTGEARWQGILVARYLTTSGKRRYVVEVKPQGFQMIAIPGQLRMIVALEE